MGWNNKELEFKLLSYKKFEAQESRTIVLNCSSSMLSILASQTSENSFF